MKPILLLLLACLPLCAATTYPMLSTTTNRTVTGGVTNLSFLNSNSVFTGTARWMGIVTLTNTGNIFVGDGAGLTGVGFATSGGVATNATIYGLTINTGSTNNALTGSRAIVTDANKGIISSATTATELGFVSGVTSALQTQINAKAETATLGGYVTNLGGLATNLTATGLTVATGQTNTHLTASSVVVTDANKGIVSGTTTADLATLSANQTFTGTNTFPAASFYTANKIGRRLLFTTNIFIPTIAVVATEKTNNGDYANVTQLFKVTMPALLSSNSMVLLSLVALRTNANAVGAQAVTFVGSATNFLSNSSAGGYGAATAVGKTLTAPNTITFANWISFTNQIQGGSTALINTPTNFVDTSTSWDLMLGFYVLTTAYTNYWATLSYYEAIGE